MKFYDCTTAPSPRRVRIFLAEKGISIDTVQVDLRNGEQFSEALGVGEADGAASRIAAQLLTQVHGEQGGRPLWAEWRDVDHNRLISVVQLVAADHQHRPGSRDCLIAPDLTASQASTPWVSSSRSARQAR